MAHTKRRMPYSIGSEKLEKLEAAAVKDQLSEDEERKLSTDMRELYDRLLPTAESEDKRIKLVQKLEKLFNDEWPGHDIRVHVFGSSGNLLCTDDSDGWSCILWPAETLLTVIVDICITTDWKELESVCKIAGLLAKSEIYE
jgi:DNA polymerase sigma